MSRLLDLCTGATIGLVVGWLWGSNTSRLIEAHALAVDYRRNEGAPMSAERRARLMAHLPAQRDTGHGPPPWPLPTGDTCPVTLGPLTCPFTGRHTNHAFQSATWAPDRKADADEEIQ